MLKPSITFLFLVPSKSILNTEVLSAFSRDHSPVFISCNEMKNIRIGPSACISL